MSEYLAKKLHEKLPEINLIDVDYETIIEFECDIHGKYTRTVHQILYKNRPGCPECAKLAKNKKLSDIGKTKVGPLNNFYGHHHTQETKDLVKQHNIEKYGVDHPSKLDSVKKKISETVKSEDCQKRTRQTLLERYGDEKYNNKEKATQTNLERYGESSYAKTDEFKEQMSEIWKNRSEEDKLSIINKSKQTKLERYGDENYNNREKFRQTCLTRYGYEIPNMYGSEDYIQNMIKKYGNSWIQYVESLAHEQLQLNISKFEQENNCTLISKLIKEYGQGWLSIRSQLQTIRDKRNVYILNSEIDKILQYIDTDSKRQKSNKEQELFEYITSIYNGKIINNTRKVITPLELDIYIPELKIAIEFNGIYWHSIQTGTPIDYHLNKSLLCRKNDIRLIHIYEFENLDEQKQLLKDLINGIDNYPKNDFNKNNLIDNIPKPEIIYDTNYIIYGSGKLY